MVDNLSVDPVVLQQRAAVINDVAAQVSGAVQDVVAALAGIRMDTGGVQDPLADQLHTSYDGPAQQLVDAARALALNIGVTADNVQATGRTFEQVETENVQTQQG